MRSMGIGMMVLPLRHGADPDAMAGAFRESKYGVVQATARLLINMIFGLLFKVGRDRVR